MSLVDEVIELTDRLTLPEKSAYLNISVHH
jgi:hypothetical protein